MCGMILVSYIYMSYIHNLTKNLSCKMCEPSSLAFSVKMISLASSLFDGIEDNDIRQIKYLLTEKKADPNIIIPDKGISPLHFISGSKPESFAIDIVKLFLCHGGNPNIRSVEGATPVHIAAAWGQEDLLRLLLLSGGDPALFDEDGLTPLDYATREENTNVIEILQTYQSTVFDSKPQPSTLNTQFSDSNPQFSLHLEKLVLDEGDVLVEYKIGGDVETRTVFTQTDNDSVENTVVPATNHTETSSLFLNNESWNRVAQWCKEQSELVEFSLTTIKTEPNCTFDKSDAVNEREYQTLGIKTANQTNSSGIKTANQTNSSTKSNCNFYKSRNGKQYQTLDAKTENQANSYIQSNLSKNLVSECSSSEAFYTCNSNYRTSQKSIASHKTISSLLTCAVSEVYRYTDKRYGIILLEKRLPVLSGTSCTEITESEIEVGTPKLLKAESRRSFVPLEGVGSYASTSDIPSEQGYCTEELRRELDKHGYPLCPITRTTKRVYIKQLFKLRKAGIHYIASPNKPKYSRELERTLKDLSTLDLNGGITLEQHMSEYFSKPSTPRHWREGAAKSSFTYLLLDPRVTCNLPLQGPNMKPLECWNTFVRSIFYVGKGKRSRPYAHLYEAVDVWNGKSCKTNKKIERIIHIWKDNQGVVCLHVFQNVIPVEAFTREAAMIDALGLANLCNQKRGEYYGLMTSKSPDVKRQLGVYLLYRALQILLHEGERQLQPLDIF